MAKAQKPPAVRKGYRKASMREAFDAISLALFEDWGRSLARRFELHHALARAGINEHPVIYASRVISYTILSAVITFIVGITLILTTSYGLLFEVITALVAGIIPLIVFAIGISYPSSVASSRKTMVENELPFFMAYASTMSKGGVSLDRIIERVSELKVFKAMREEAQRMVTNVKYFGMDPITAIDRVVYNHPSTKFRDVMLGYITTLKSGGDVVHYLETRTQELFASRMNELRMTTERLGSFLEVYIILGVIMSITIFVFFAVSGTLTAVQSGQGGGTPDLTLPALYNFIGLPAIGVMVLLMIHTSQPKTPVKRMVPYYVLLITLPIATLGFFVTLWTLGGGDLLLGHIGIAEAKSTMIALTVAILIAFIPPWVVHERELKGSKGLIRATADFLRDLAEVRKTGLSPEKCIISLTTRDYRNLTPIVGRAGAALSSGMSLEVSLRKILARIKEWFVIAIFRFLTDSIVVGGGSPDIIDALSRFTQNLAELEEETRRRLRAYVALPYFGTVLLAASPIIIINLLTQAAEVSPDELAPLILTLGAGVMVNAVIMGLVAGKVSETYLAAGFKHVVIMSLVAVITIMGTLIFMGL